MNCVLTSRNGRTYEIEVPATRGGDSRYVFALHKSGSVLLNSIVSDLAKLTGSTFFDLPGTLFASGLSTGDIAGPGVPPVLQIPGLCYGGFREYPHSLELELPGNAKFIYLVRDPRDILVSLYFSIVYSHPLPQEGVVRGRLTKRKERAIELGIDSYVLDYAPEQIAEIIGYNQKLLPLLAGQGALFRYEDVIFRKKEWIAEICKVFGWPVRDAAIEEIALRHDVRRSEEVPSEHIRQVVPGDYRSKLRRETIERLTVMFSGVATELGYDLKP